MTSNIMFPMRQIVRHDVSVDLPKCMYKLKNIHVTNGHSPSGDHVLDTEKNFSIPEQNYQNQEMTALENQQKEILRQLAELKNQMLEIRKTLQCNKVTLGSDSKQATVNVIPLTISVPDLIINASPSHPPYSLVSLQKLWSDVFNLKVKTFTHSTVGSLTKEAKKLSSTLENFKSREGIPTIKLRLIWKDVGANIEFRFHQAPIIGEVNILRYFSRLIENHLNYELSPKSLEIDTVLDLCYLLNYSKTKSERNVLLQQLEKWLGKSLWFCNNIAVSIADIAVYSAIKQIPGNEINKKFNEWLTKCEKHVA